MASTVLPNGIIIPEKYSRDWYNDLYHNWQELDNLLGGGGGANDGTLTIQKNGTTVGTFSANQATNETINIEVPAVNDATLTIQKNGTTVDTFTANSSTDKTVDITVPTKTSDLTNDSGFITSDSTKIPLAGSNQISGSLIPATTNAYDLGTSTNKWKSFNGINPGALSLPDSAGIVDILSTLQTTGFTASIDGYVRARKYVNSSAAHTFGIKNTNTGIEIRSIAERTFEHHIWIPVRAGEKVVISDDWEDASNVSKDYSAFFIPCKGNV